MKKLSVPSIFALVFSLLVITGCGSESPTPARFLGNLNPPPTVTDLPFSVDCSALDPSRQNDCNTFINDTRDKVYPLWRNITGVSLSSCYDEVTYTILPQGSLEGIGGFADNNHITLLDTYSINDRYKVDVHELLHSISTCSGALDDHMFHGMIQNYVYGKLGISTPGYFIPTTLFEPDLIRAREGVRTATGDTLIYQCKGIVSGELLLAYFSLSELALQRLYRSTFAATPHSSPSREMINVWGDQSNKVQALIETLEEEKDEPLNIPQCGY